MKKIEIWENLKDLFDTDDGSLPEIILKIENQKEKMQVFKLLVSITEISPDQVISWDEVKQKDITYCQFNSEEELFEALQKSSRILPLSRIKTSEGSIPDLGCIINEDSLELDYRMGKEWDSEGLFSLFKLLKKVKEISPTIQIEILEEGEAPFTEEQREKFKETVRHFIK